MLYERSSWLSGFDVPTLVLWADGTVAMGDTAGTNAHHYGLDRTASDAALPPAAQPIAAVYRRLLAVRPPSTGPLAQSAPRPDGWPTALPVYRGQVMVDQVMRCSIRAQMTHAQPGE